MSNPTYIFIYHMAKTLL